MNRLSLIVAVGCIIVAVLAYVDMSSTPQSSVPQISSAPLEGQSVKKEVPEVSIRILESTPVETPPPQSLSEGSPSISGLVSDPEPAVVSNCSFRNLFLPKNAKVFAAGGYSGRELDFAMDDSGHAATQFDVVVNSVNNPVVLMLGAYEPSIWKISRTQGSLIMAVVLSGYYTQEIVGLDEDIPVVTSTYDNKGDCGYFYIEDAGNTKLNPIARTLFDMPVDLVFKADANGSVTVGELVKSRTRLISSGTMTVDSFKQSGVTRTGQAGLADAVAQRTIRNATQADFDRWSALNMNQRANRRVPAPLPMLMSKSYVVLRDFKIPSDLYGGNSAIFFIPNGVPMPTGELGHSAMYIFESGQCIGSLCNFGSN